MLKTLELLRKRRSIRQFTPEPLTSAQMECLQEIALRSPSSRALTPWHFVFVTDTDTLHALGQAKAHGCAFLQQCALAVVLCADPQRSDVWIEDCSLAATLLHLGATDMGLGSCWVQIRERQHDEKTDSETYVRSVLKIPAQMRVHAIIGIGNPAEEKHGHTADTLPAERIHLDQFDPQRLLPTS
ncbi:MAG: nitroreductase family protein [Desulfuromonadaceae bacterium]|nr:nitroreductase family protein [Desulfuromonas sp.]MDY0212706.1 nitroreductase family protein [Desulfuromonadaceae bacterium]